MIAHEPSQPNEPAQPMRPKRGVFRGQRSLICVFALIGVIVAAASCSAGGSGSPNSSEASPASLPHRAKSAPSQKVSPSGTSNSVNADSAALAVLHMGETATLSLAGTGSGRVTVWGAVHFKHAPDANSDPPANGYYLAVNVAVKAVGRALDVNPSDFYYRSPDGTHINQDDGNATEMLHTHALDDVTLNPGERAQGKIYFDVPSPHGAIVYAPGSDSAALSEWRLPRPGNSAPAPRPVPAVTPKPSSPQPTHVAKPARQVLLYLSGSGIKTTQQFTVAGDHWTLQYSYNCSGFGGTGNFAVYDYAGGSLSDILVNELGSRGSSSTEVYSGGTHHLEINSECLWHVKAVS